MTRKRHYPEDDIQKECVKYLWDMELLGLLTFFHTPNGGKRNIREAARFKALGVRPGVSDLTIILSGGRSLFVELKAPKGTTTDKQDKFLARVGILGCPTAVCKSVSELQDFLEPYLKELAA